MQLRRFDLRRFENSIKNVLHFDREQSIFECMIANLFEVYKFFPKYPEKQLKTAATLFGEFLLYILTL